MSSPPWVVIGRFNADHDMVICIGPFHARSQATASWQRESKAHPNWTFVLSRLMLTPDDEIELAQTRPCEAIAGGHLHCVLPAGHHGNHRHEEVQWAA